MFYFWQKNFIQIGKVQIYREKNKNSDDIIVSEIYLFSGTKSENRDKTIILSLKSLDLSVFWFYLICYGGYGAVSDRGILIISSNHIGPA